MRQPSYLTTDGAMHFQVSVNIQPNELRGWPPDRIAALFAGLGRIVAAAGERRDEAVPPDQAKEPA